MWSCRLELSESVARHTPPLSMKNGMAFFARAGARGAPFESAAGPGGTWLRDSAQSRLTIAGTAIGRPLSRMPVIIRSHESSGVSMMEDAGWGMEYVEKNDKLLILNGSIFQELGFSPRFLRHFSCAAGSEVWRDRGSGRLVLLRSQGRATQDWVLYPACCFWGQDLGA